ncbi:Integral membrane sensor signal transduction histidine kinase [Hyella patelloides LEGE 07179]|uniref:histidine kinase n=1 Tax=Hyella patelloides LEGE 07179 TaxID=945734 RepID=A0A563VRQ2_9CYAN|nr:ATP-binding protein [Hyella patelloides]VEP14134.1 Integral membrane sensor signal transduction histidine kinase [Hyella patelloides LEGE 07179]
MKLRQKLLSTFGGLAVLALLNAGVTGWAIFNWQASNRELNHHYQRSLLVKELKIQVVKASQSIREAISMNESNGRSQFETEIAPVEQYFQDWSQLVHNEAERKQMQQLKNAYLVLLSDSEEIFQLLAEGRKFEALQLRREKLQNTSFPLFEELSERAIESDKQNRQKILKKVKQSQSTAELVLILAAFGTISLTLLLIAYLNSDLFTPLKEVKQALDNFSQGDRQIHLDTERSDEIGSVNRAFNRLVESIQEREKLLESAALGIKNKKLIDDKSEIGNVPSRLLVHQLLNQMEVQLAQLDSNDGNSNGKTIRKQALVSQIKQLLQTVTHLTEFGFPLDLNLTQTDIRALVYEVFISVREELIDRSISIELEIAPEVKKAFVDRLKLREALIQLVDNALSALPETGGRIGIWAKVTANRAELLLAVTDNGTGIKQSLLERAFNGVEVVSEAGQNRSPMGLKLTKAIVEQHGGKLLVKSKPDQGTQVQIKLPIIAKQQLSPSV